MDQIQVRITHGEYADKTGLLGPADSNFPHYDRTVTLDDTNEEIGINVGDFVVI